MATEKVKPNSTPRGSVNLWPVLLMAACSGVYERPAAKVEKLEAGKPAAVELAKARELAAEITAGDHDAYLFELLSLEFGHGRRDAVISAVQARAEKLGLKDCPTDPQKS